MSRRHAPRVTLEHLASDLAREARESGDSEGALEVFRRFLDEDRGLLGNIVHDAVAPEGRLWELLQRELDARHRRRRGMFFTPRPLVEFIIRSVGRCQRRFPGQPQWHIIDPACGCGAFLIDAAQQLAAARYTGLEIDGATCEVARMLLAGHGSNVPQIVQTNPLLAGESLRETILGPPASPLVPVIVGNPPWSNFGRQNRGQWIDGLLTDYRAGLGERKSNLSDDAIKFIRWAQFWIDSAGAGVLALVTPNTWLTGLTHRRMRESLLNSFDGISVVNLHGEGSNASDENVFGVRSGVAVVLAVKCNIHKSGSTGPAKRMQCASLRGSRANKFATLEIQSLPSIAREIVRTGPPHWRLAEDTDRTGLYSSAADEYASYWPVDRIFRHYTSGVQTKNDAMFVGFTPDQVAQQVRARLKRLRDAPPFDAALIQPYMLAPFDRRWVYYDSRVIGRARLAVMRHMLRPNLGLVFMRQSTNAGEYDHFLAVDCLVSDRVFYSRHGAPFLAPLWLADEGSGFGVQGSGRQSNLAVDFCDHITEAVGEPLDPLEVFHYLYAMAYSPRYRARYAAQLKRGFPRFGLPVSREQYQRLGALGRQLVELHVAGLGRSTPGAGLLPVKDGIDATGDEFRIGGYDVLKRWARPRRASGLSADDERQLDRLAWIGRETRRLTEEIEAKHEV